MKWWMIVAFALLGCGTDGEERINMAWYEEYDESVKAGQQQGQNTKPKDGWQQSGVLTTGNTSNEVRMQANFPESDVYTVQFNVDADLGFAARAEVIWAVEGGLVRRLIDIADGISISGVAQGVQVRVFDNSNGLAPPGNNYTVYVQAARGARPASVNPPILWEDVQTFTGVIGQSIVYQVPRDAGVKSVQVQATGIDTVTFAGLVPRMIATQQNAGSTVLYRWDPVTEPGFVPLIPGCTQVAIVFADITANIQVTTTTVWGIDG